MIRPAKEKLEAALELIDRLRSGVFPYPHAEDVLARIKDILSAAGDPLDPDADPDALREQCNIIVILLNRFLPYLGFLYRSKSSANAFELYGPLLRMVRELVDDDSKLVIASEWEFSPFTYVASQDLKGAILVGLPASESSNALLTPLAGHEVGHHIWAANNLTAAFHSTILNAIISRVEGRWAEYRRRFPEDPADIDDLLQDAFSFERWTVPQYYAMRQIEEVFCDLVGTRIFGQAYVHAFAYLLCPGPASRSPEYPPLPHRVAFMKTAAGHWGYSFPQQYDGFWTPYQQPTPMGDEDFLMAIVDAAVEDCVGQLIDVVDRLIPQSRFPVVTSRDVDAVERSLLMLTPVASAASLPAIVNAGWRIYFRDDAWTGYSGAASRKAVVLNELLLKSAQVTEVLALLEAGEQ